MHRLIRHVRSNAISYLALFVALGGTSYAAINLPAGSVGPRQLKNGAVTTSRLANGSVTPKKLDSKAFGGAVRHWAFVNDDGHVIGGSRGTHVSMRGHSLPYYVTWGDQFSHSCAVLASSPGMEGFAPIADTVGLHVNAPASPRGKTEVWVWPSRGGTLIQARFYIAVIC
ncbi:MAG: hypothetical protein ACJ76X_04040 [Solirubrobacteraceae bacterium]